MEKTSIGDVCSHSTSVVKAFTWRFIATSITTLLVLLISGKLDLALEVGALDIVTKLIAYYLHERGWLKYGHRLEFLTVAYCKVSEFLKAVFGRRKS
jgi:uncharacterized membrane protein